VNVLVLAAGYGVRLHPITETVSKALLEVGSRPMIEHVVERFAPLANGGRTVVVTNAKFAADFDSWLAGYDGHPVELLNNGSTHADNRLGANGDIEFSIERAGLHGEDLLIVGADNYFTAPQDAFVRFAASKPATIATIELETTDEVKRFAAVETDTAGRVLSFEEKPKSPKTKQAGTMLYYLNAASLPLVGEYLASGEGNPDNAGYLYAWLGSRIETYACPLEGEWIDVGSHGALDRANALALR
jgi:glucose-1-phosphate thymidylyltransferase